MRGMNMLGITDLLKSYPTLMKSLLVADGGVLTSDQFKSFIGSLKPSEPLEQVAYIRFMEMITNIGGKYFNILYIVNRYIIFLHTSLYT